MRYVSELTGCVLEVTKMVVKVCLMWLEVSLDAVGGVRLNATLAVMCWKYPDGTLNNRKAKWIKIETDIKDMIL